MTLSLEPEEASEEAALLSEEAAEDEEAAVEEVEVEVELPQPAIIAVSRTRVEATAEIFLVFIGIFLSK
jgi:hypothetical protein